MSDPPWSELVDALDVLLLAVDGRGSAIAWNRPVEEVTGLTGEELDTTSLAGLFGGRDAERVRDAVARAIETGDARVEAGLVAAGGETRPYDFTVRALPGNVPGAYVAIGRALADRVDARKDREEVLDRMSDGFFAVDRDWNITYIHDRGAEILAKAMDRDPDATTFEGLHLWEQIPDAEETTSYERSQRAMETGEASSFRTYSPAVGQWFDVRVFPSGTGLSVYFYDVTEERAQHEKLERRERTLRNIYEVIADREASFSEQVGALLAIGREELGLEYGTLSKIDGEQYTFEFVDADDDSIQPGDVVPLEATNCEITATTERTLVLGDVEQDAPEETVRQGYAEWGISCYVGAPVFVSDSVYGTFCFYDREARVEEFSDWEVTLVELMSRWISSEMEKLDSTEKLRRQNEQLERFAEVLTHDLRNPLSVAMGHLEVLQAERDDEHLDIIEKSHDRIESLIDEMLALARQGRSIRELEQVNLERIVDRSWAVVGTDGASRSVESNLTFMADPNRLQQLVENLIRNAREHGGDGVAVTVGALPDGFFLADDGDGIPEGDFEQVFDAGYSSQEEGSGFGLAIVREIANAHGWRVDVSESEAGGARFEFAGVDVVES